VAIPLFPQAELGKDRGQYELRVANWRQIYQEDWFREFARQVLGDRQGKARLAYSCRAGKGNEARLLRAQKAAYDRNVPATPDERRQRRD
jgi:hypothetical protein